jgi:hypothetical protein
MTIREAKNIVKRNGYKVVEAYKDDGRPNRSEIKELVVFCQESLNLIDKKYKDSETIGDDLDYMEESCETMDIFDTGLRNFGIAKPDREDIKDLIRMRATRGYTERAVEAIIKAMSY